ncbi:Pex19-domain-containing protein [Aspergillus japonicus CBS 114.51]|uniref:Pex19-domain-containing protein n=1 Tax=Aspergillus japonicus CBS 114.51 TaxID=1448312 RepID=A0A8T8WNU8_ASPJA|nr:Pex19-domain-containing protein [Aspergillus japonicus CBS 114.51]RAH77525.1 Pex19-domain-containing protein [Aspergillus japonicus CBS 114.51]
MSSSTSQADASPAQTQAASPEHAQIPSTNNPSTTTTTTTNPAVTTTTTTTTANPASTTTSSTPPPPAQVANNNKDDDDDDDSDFDELDDVLDNFNKPAASTAQPPAASASASSAKDATAATTTDDADLDEEAFLKQLEKDMANLMGAGAGAGARGDASASIPEGFGDEESLDKDAEMFAKLLEEGGVSAEDFLKQLVGDMMKGEAGSGPGNKSKKKGSAAAGGGATAGEASATQSAADAAAPDAAAAATPETFNDTIQRTIERMKESGDKATAAAEEEDGDADDLVAQLIKAIEAGAGAGAGGDGDDADLTKMFQGMMEQLSNKEILYEPMKELDTKFGPWLAENKAAGKVSGEELQRYEKQAAVVAQIVAKFEDQAYTDEDPKCREYVWEKMQEMQACGNPPDELIPAPMMEDLMGGGAGPGAPDCPQQ